MAELRVEVERLTKTGPRSLDAREPVVSLTVEEDAGEPALRLVVRHVVPTVRPNEVLAGLAAMGLPVGDDVRTTRRCQGPLRDGVVGDPLG